MRDSSVRRSTVLTSMAIWATLGGFGRSNRANTSRNCETVNAVVTDGSSTQTRTANQQNEITSISGQTTPTYDANGNMTGDQTGKTLIFDAWNHLVQFKNGATLLQTYGYDALGRRITENPGTQRDLFWDSAWQLVEEDIA